MFPKFLTREEFEAARGPVTADSPSYVRDWAVYSVLDRGPQEKFRYRVVGLNMNDNHEFTWDIPGLNWRYYWDVE